MLEVKFAKQSGVGMIPVMMEGGLASVGMARFDHGGSLWFVCLMSRSLESIRQLYGQIQGWWVLLAG